MKLRNSKLSKKTLALGAAAILLFASGGFMGVMAAPSVQSDEIVSSFGMADEAVVLVENGNALSGSEEQEATLNLDHFDKDSKGNIMVKPGKSYQEELIARNMSTHDQYVRLIIRKYWAGAEGKDPTLTPDMIGISIGNGWKKSTAESTDETTMLYYTEKLAAGATSPAAVKGITVSDKVLDAVDINEESEKVGNKTIYTYEYAFDGCAMVIEAELQAVQTHNADEALISVWGNDAPKAGADGKLQVE